MFHLCANGFSVCRDNSGYALRQRMLDSGVTVYTDAKLVMAALNAWDFILQA